ncbi:MAG: hypothetical protein ACXVEF_10940 [Polyangiales bacterium]
MSEQKEPTRFERFKDYLSRSGRIFLLGLMIACGIEVLVDWNSTLFEINVLRDRMRERGFNYVGILSRSTEKALEAGDAKSLEIMSAGLFDDEDVVLVRFVAPDGKILWERVDPELDEKFEKRRGKPLRTYYEKQIDRDVAGILADPDALRKMMAASRYRDVAQAWSDTLEKLAAKFTAPKPLRANGLVLYQDRLRTNDKQHDDAITYALGQVKGDSGKPVGAIVVAFAMDRTNAQIRTKYLKGFGMIVFFVGLILIQNVIGRRDKLRLLDLEARYGAAKKKLRETMPKAITEGAFKVAGAIDQAPGAVDGMAWDVRVDGRLEILLVDPDGDGVDAAAVALLALRTFRNQKGGTPLERATAIGEATTAIPLTRPVGVTIIHVSSDGTVDGVTSPGVGVRVLHGKMPEAKAIAEVPEGLVGPLIALSGELPAGSSLVIVAGHEAREEADEVTALVLSAANVVVSRAPKGIDLDAVAQFVERAHAERGGDLQMVASDAATWARGRFPSAAGSDLAVLALTRS